MEPPFLATSKAKRDPKMIGMWKVGRTLGKGNSGHVRIARHSKTGQYAAIKIISKSTLPSRVSLNRVADEVERNLLAVEREIVIMKLLDHPNIMKLYDVWETSSNLYLVLEYVQGGELFDYLCTSGPRPIPEVLDYFQQLICAVDYCHRFNIAHRDLKLENILIDQQSNIKVADFGMAAWQDRAAKKLLLTSCGSPHYAAPEVVSGKPYNGAPADIWSCGVILYALIVARLPFDDDDCAAVLKKIAIGKYDLPDDIDPDARHLIARMLTTDPEKRITMPEIFRHPFFTSRPFKTPPHSTLPEIDHVGQPIKHFSSIDPDLFANLRTLWHGTPDSELIDALMNSERNWQKGIYHLLMHYRARCASANDSDDPTKGRRNFLKQPSLSLESIPDHLDFDFPPREPPPTPQRALGRHPLSSYDNGSISSGHLISPALPHGSASPVLPEISVPELNDPKLQQFFQQVANHLNVLQARTSGSDGNPSPDASPKLALEFEERAIKPLGPRQALASSSGNQPTIRFFEQSQDTKPLNLRRKAGLPLPTVKIADEKENQPVITESDILRSQSPLGTSQRNRGLNQHQDKRLHILPASLERRFSRSKKREPNRLSSSPAASDASSSFLLPSPADSFTSSPKRGWIDNVFKFKPTTYALYSKHDVHTTRNECRRLLMHMDLLVWLEESEKLGILKCRSSDSKDSQSSGAKSLKFRVELQWPTPQLCQDGYVVTLNLVQEKGSLGAFKGVYQHLTKIWTLGSGGSVGGSPSPAQGAPLRGIGLYSEFYR